MKNRIIFTCVGCSRIFTIGRINELFKSAYYDWADSPRRLGRGEVFAEVLRAIGQKKSTDPRDQIYGILGIIEYIKGEKLPDELAPNYRLSYAETYWIYAAFLLHSAGDLHLLTCDHNELQGVPSWVPDFRYITKGVPMPGTSVYISSDKRILHLQGCILGKFSNILPGLVWNDIMPRRERIPIELTSQIKTFERRILEPSASMREIKIEEAFNEMMEFAKNIFPENDTISFYEVYSNLRDAPKGRRSRTAKKKRTRRIALKEEVIALRFSSPLLLCHDGTVLNAMRKDIEVGPDDLLCLFKGCTQPGLLRASGDSFIFLGLCKTLCGPLKNKNWDDEFWASADVRDIKLI
ncbi:hypothetical protein F5Y11DRAFT_364760 [Daldinia sp. FL1419]|nr:hypothetical protein F5Y11DRAFT_364760 [Daldinia sp. FL1419]